MFKQLSVVLVVCVAALAQAESSLQRLFAGQALKEVCGNTVEVTKGGALYHEPILDWSAESQNLFVVQSRRGVEGPLWYLWKVDAGEADRLIFLKQYKKPIYGVELVGDELWVLFRDNFEVLDTQKGGILFGGPTFAEWELPSKHHRAYALTHWQDKVFVAHGAYGLVTLSAATGEILGVEDFGLGQQKGGHRSKVMAVTLTSNGQLVLGVDNMTPPQSQGRAFNGLIKMPVGQLGDHSFHAYDPDPKKGGVIAYARLASEGDTLYVNNLGILQLFHWPSLKSVIQPKWKRLSVDLYGKDRNLRLHGDILIEGGQVFGCGSTYLGDVKGQPELLSMPLSLAKWPVQVFYRGVSIKNNET